MERGKVEDGRLLVPFKHTDEGWAEFGKMIPQDPVRLWTASMDGGDWERLERLRAADAIFTQELGQAQMLKGDTQQAFAVLLPVKSVGVMGDGRTYEEVIALRAVTTEDFMTADWARLPYDLLAHASRRIVNEVPGVNRVVYDITSKPPGTIEWE